MRRIRTVTTLILSFAMTTGSAVLAPESEASDDPWRAVKAATARFHSFTQAEREGYSIEGEPCVQSPAGAMGIHAVSNSLVNDQSIDPDRPEVLLYMPDANGNLKLVGIEYFMVTFANTDAGPSPWFGVPNDPTDPNRDPNVPPPDGFLTPTPMIFGRVFDGPMPGHSPVMPWHADLHVWLWESNASGLFAPFNPALACPA